MAGNDISKPVDVNNPSPTRRSSDLLPNYHRTDRNSKFLASTLDQLIQQPQIKRLDGFIGSKLSPKYDPTSDQYVPGKTKLRTDYQLEPSLVIADVDKNVQTAIGFDDLINQLSFNGADVSNLDSLFRSSSFSYNPHIDWDKFVNFRQYYWMPTGPDSVEIFGKQQEVQSTFTVTDTENGTLNFNPPNSTNPLLTLYRGLTYVFNVDSAFPFFVKTAFTAGVENLYTGTTNNGTRNGQVIVTIDEFTPNTLFYFAEGSNTAFGQFVVKSLEENTDLDITADILGKKNYRSQNGVEFSNGMKVRFAGNVVPEEYLNKEWFVEGVGDAIKLIDYASLTLEGIETSNLNTNFDATLFDEYPFDDFRYVPLIPEYITINRAAQDKNPWSKYNRWVHQDVIVATAKANGVEAVFNADLRAQRPIIEFVAGLQLHNYGTTGKANVDLIDDSTTNAFKTVENSAGYHIDGIKLEAGNRVVFNADTDDLVRGKIYEVKIVFINNREVINLEEVLDSQPNLRDSIIVTKGTTYAGTAWWFNGDRWQFGQQKTSLNQAPLFELFDSDGNRYANQSIYKSSFFGTKIFGYRIGTVSDSVLGFNVAYRNISNTGEFLFDNFYMTDTFTNFNNAEIEVIEVKNGFLKINNGAEENFVTVWTKTVDKPIPILQYQVPQEDTVFIEINSIDNPGYARDLVVDVFVNDVKQTLNYDFVKEVDQGRCYIVSTTTFKANSRVLFKLYTSRTPNENGYYEPPINLTNNPLNGNIEEFTFTEISDHVKTMIDFNGFFSGNFPGQSNLRDLGDITSYGSRLVSHSTPISFAHYFLGSTKHNAIDAIRKVSNDYNQFKSNLIREITELKGLYAPAQALDIAMISLNSEKTNTFNYKYSDMLPFGKNFTTRVYTVTDPRNVRYSLATIFNDTVLSNRAVLVYINNSILLKGYDYEVNLADPSITIKKQLVKGDVITVLDYPNTDGSYVPPTPTKLGLYPKFKPSIFEDNTYLGEPRRVIQGHDGSITLAFNDYRDDIILEYETRVYNNIKVSYKPELLNVNSVLPGAFRNTGLSQNSFTNLVAPDFLKWAGYFGVNYKENNSYDELNSFTFNHTGSIDTLSKNPLRGYWRGVYKYFFDTDRPHTHPWEMLGFTEQPEWWVDTYGPAPYTKGNLLLWEDLEAGKIAVTPTGPRINPLYARPGLTKIIPVNDSGELISPTEAGLATTPIINPNDPKRVIMLRSEQVAADWNLGDYSPAETAWYRSSYWPFACQVVLALSRPSDYAALMFDTSRITENLANEFKYGENREFISPAKVLVPYDTVNDEIIRTSGYSVFVVEAGTSTDQNCIEEIRSDLTAMDYRLMAKLGSFTSKDKLSVSIDAVDVTSPYPGVLIPSEDYQIFFNKSAPVESISISGLIIQKTKTGWSVRGYDRFSPFFRIYRPLPSNIDQIERVGGFSESFVNWSPNTTYNSEQIVFYSDRYYRSKQKHNSGLVFTPAFYQSLPYLPTVGGVGVLRRTVFDSRETVISYGVEYKSVQEVYDLILGYGQWLTSKGFVFDEYNADLDQILDWRFTAKEFLYWTTQNWSVNSVITLSPFANKLVFRSDIGIVDSVDNTFYEYSLLKADGAPFPKNNFTVVRLDGEFSVNTMNTQEGLFFAKINLVQKEHALVMNNFTLFNDVVYDPDTGYRQRRVKVKGFVTDNWNGDFFSPGFVFDQATVLEWEKFKDYKIGDVVRFSGNYYSAIKSIIGTKEFDITQWAILNEKPSSQLLPNFEYKINQFEDFYSLDIDNFDIGQQAMAQHLIGYTPRPYLNYIIGDPIAQYKFYQGFIRDKGSKRSLTTLTKASLSNLSSSVDFSEDWAFRIGYYGGFNTYQEIEINLESNKFLGNPQIVEFVETTPIDDTGTTYYKEPDDVIIKPQDFNISNIFETVENAEDVFQLPTAGFVRFDDITATAYNKNSVLDIANNSSLKTGNTIWVGFKENGEWDVLRVTDVPTYISAVAINVPGESIVFTTFYAHQLVVGDLISVTGVATTINQVYVVEQIIDNNRFVVLSTLTSLPALPDTLVGLIFTFKSSRLKTFDDLSRIPYLDRWKEDEKVWVDSDGTGKWAVYKKTNNYDASIYNSESGLDIATNQHYGSKIFSTDDSKILLVASTGYTPAVGADYRGRVSVLVETTFDSYQAFDDFSLNDRYGQVYYNVVSGLEETGFGQALSYNSADFLIAIGAPYTSRVKAVITGTNIVDDLSTTSLTIKQGVVKLSTITSSTYQLVDNSVVITTPTAVSSSTFGHSLVMTNISTTTAHKLLVGAPDIDSTGTGAVYQFSVSVTSTISVSTGTVIRPTLPVASSKFGWDISGTRDLSRYAVAAPGYVSTLSNGAVYVFDSLGNQIQQITGDFLGMGSEDIFGTSVKMSSDGQFLFVASPYAFDSNLGLYSGVVDIFTATTASTYVYSQRISAPISALTSATTFGWDISINDTAEILTITAVGDSKTPKPTFDKYVERYNSTEISSNSLESDYVNDPTSVEKKVFTTYDGGTTSFTSKTGNAGTVHVYNRLGTGTTKFAYAQQLIDTNVQSGSMFGYTAFTLNDSIYVGAPAKLLNGSNGLNSGKGQFFAFDKINTEVNSWEEFRKQDPLVDLTSVKRAITINNDTQQIQDYIDIIDPLKGNILGTASQEIRYISPYDPAVYSLGIGGVNIDSNTNWLDEHVGELWWDLSTVKYVWYEQGELEYRKNNWNNIFPGSQIDVYEWVRSEYLPAEWSQLADTPDGLTRGISGQPKFIDNSVISIKQVYNSVSNQFTNVYYYWVKNKVTVPANVPNRNIASFEVAQQIADPIGTGAKFLAIISPTAISLANSKSVVKTENINLNISFDIGEETANRHTEWQIISENDRNARFNSLIEKKLIDSLLGRDSVGNPVPDPTLPSKLQYGVEIRPRQSLFVNRLEAIRNIVEYTNSILLENRITDKIDFTNLQATDELPSPEVYDAIVDDIFNLELIVTTSFVRAQIEPVINSNGQISGINISGVSLDGTKELTGGFGYITAPTITIEGDGEGAVLRAVINEFGIITDVIIVEPGKNYTTEGTSLVVRPYTAVVINDASSQGKWALYEWSQELNQWIKMKTQDFNTTLFWKYVDWQDSTYDPLQNLVSSVPEPYALNVLNILPQGSYVKVQNGGDGRYIIVRRTDGTQGTFDSNWDVVYSERGTIQFLNSLWDPSASLYAWDQVLGFDQAQYSQTPDKEVEFILNSIKNDIFIDELKEYWNKLVFKAVKYALSEQKFLDWAFKTTFISVVNNAGELSQPPTYQLESARYYEDFLKEIKPYHTKIRKFTNQYSLVEPTNTFNTDFDLPSFWNTSTLNFNTVEFGSQQLLNYPWKSWYDNYTYEVESIEVYDGGSGYTQIPKVTIVPAPGDEGFGATAVAYISLGKVSRIIVTNPGQGYTATPRVVISGGGSTTLTPAIAYAQLGNNPVRHNLVRLKFDRTTALREVGSQTFTQRFVCDGQDISYELDWAPLPNKEQITLLRNGQLQLIDSFTILYSKVNYVTQEDALGRPISEYTKLYASLKLNYTPDQGDILEITYPKSLDLYNAASRIEDYYEPTFGMPGKDLAQLMSGVEYSGLQISGLPFNAIGGWDAQGIAWAQNPYDNLGLEDGYASFVTTSTTEQSFVLNSLITTGTQVNVYLRSAVDTSIAGVRIDDEDYEKIYTVDETSSSTNVVTIDSAQTISFKPGDAVIFNGTGVGTLTTGTRFFVKQVLSPNTFKLSNSDDVDDPELNLPTLVSPSLSMTVETPGAFIPTLVGLGTGAVDRFEVIVPGKGYLGPFTTLSISAPNTLSGTNAQGQLVFSVVGAEIENGGDGYAVGDLLYVNTSSGNAILSVSSIEVPRVAAYSDAKVVTTVTNTLTSSAEVLFLDGFGDHIAVTSSVDYAFSLRDFTIETYLRPLNNGTIKPLFDFRTATTSSAIYMGLTPDNYVDVYIQGQSTITNTVAVSTSTWSHVALTRWNKQLRLYVNGTQVGPTVTDNTNYGARPVLIGTDFEKINYYQGYIDDVRIVKGTALYTGTSFTVSSTPLTEVTNTKLLVGFNSSVDIRPFNKGAVKSVRVVNAGEFVSTTPTTAIETTASVVTTSSASLQLLFGVSKINVTNAGSGYTEPPVVTITEAINPTNPTSTVTIDAFARAVLKAEFRNINSSANTSTITIPAAAFTTSNSLVMFRYSTSDGTVIPTDIDSLDSIVSGGDLSMTTALGINPSEIILDGGSQATRHITGMMDDGFLNPVESYAPEECVPGQVKEALGISVYTQPTASSPVIANKHYYVDGTTRTFKLGLKPVNAESVIVLFNNQRYTANNYTIDYEANTFTFNSINPGTGWLSITSLQLGSLGLLDTFTVTTSSNQTIFTSSISESDVGSAYVTVNGVAIPQGTTENQNNTYFLTDYLGASRVIVNKPGTIQVYLFRGTAKSFSEINEQEFVSQGTPTEFTLNPAPGNAEPYHSQVIVVKNGVRLKPPVTTYYQVDEGQTIFDVSKSQVYPYGRPDLAAIEVYVNGDRILPRNRWDLDQPNNRIIFRPGVLNAGDAVAIVFKEGHDYLVQGDKVILSTPAEVGDRFLTTTFTNHDPDFIRTERFKASAGNQYVMQRSILDSSYVWVTYNGQPLSVNLDYTVGSDGRTVTIREGIFQSPNHYVVITSFGNPESLIAFRMFKDILGRTHYKRLSEPGTTVLAQNFLLTDTMIAVEDPSVLTPPDPKFNKPGVVLIDGERIEFFAIEGNILRQLRRSTLGTGPREIHYAGTYVVDQGANQTVPFEETVQRYTTATTTATIEYLVTDVITFNTLTNYSDQVEVRYQGRLLLKPTTAENKGIVTYSHNNDIAFDSTSTADTIVPNDFTVSSTGTVILNTLTVTIVEGGRLEVLKRQARDWYDRDSTLATNNTPVARFISSVPAGVPRFLTSSTYVPVDLTWYIETGDALTDENSSPLQGI